MRCQRAFIHASSAACRSAAVSSTNDWNLYQATDKPVFNPDYNLSIKERIVMNEVSYTFLKPSQAAQEG